MNICKLLLVGTSLLFANQLLAAPSICPSVYEIHSKTKFVGAQRMILPNTWALHSAPFASKNKRHWIVAFVKKFSFDDAASVLVTGQQEFDSKVTLINPVLTDAGSCQYSGKNVDYSVIAVNIPS